MRAALAIAGMAAALGLAFTASVAGAQTLRTEVVTVNPPDGWVLSVWQGGTIEVGEFTPPGQTGAAFVDLLGYSALPLTDDGPRSVDELRAFETINAHKDCQVSAMRERAAPQDWFGLVRICIGRDGRADDTAEMEFALTTTTEQGLYRIWRTHRVPFADLVARADLHGVTPEQLDETRFQVIADAWAPMLAHDLDAHEICDLAQPAGCETFPRSLPPEAERWFDGEAYIVAAWAPGQNRITRERFLEFFDIEDDGTPNQVIAVLGADEIDWEDEPAIDSLLTMFAYGQAADGAVLGVMDRDQTLSPTERAGIRALVIASLRRLVRPETSPFDIVVALPAE